MQPQPSTDLAKTAPSTELEHPVQSYRLTLHDSVRHTLPPVVIVQAVQLSLTNVRAVASWIRDAGGAVAGLRTWETGETDLRGLELGDLDGSTERFWVGDWVVQTSPGYFRRYRHRHFLLMFELSATLD